MTQDNRIFLYSILLEAYSELSSPQEVHVYSKDNICMYETP